jgi:hypothetical protein
LRRAESAPRVEGGSTQPAKVRVRLRTGVEIEGCAGVDTVPLVGVERVIQLHAKLEAARPAHRHVLEERDVPVDEARGLQFITPRISDPELIKLA